MAIDHGKFPAPEAVDASSAISETVFGSDFVKNALSVDSSVSKTEMEMQQQLAEMLSSLKLNPMAEEFVPSSYGRNRGQLDFGASYFVPVNEGLGNGGGVNNLGRQRRNNFSQGRRWWNKRPLRAEREDSIRRTVYVSDIDHNVTEEQLAVLFSGFGEICDCRVCGDPNSRLRFAFVEFSSERSARAALSLHGTILGFSPVKVLPSKTAILPVNPTYLPRSENEREMCIRTVYCTNIDKNVTYDDVKIFFQKRCGEVSRLRLLGDSVHSTRIAFVEFVVAESAIAALDCSGHLLGTQRIRVSPSKTPVRPRVPPPSQPGRFN